MILVLGDLLADLSLRIDAFPVQAGGMQRVSYFELGPGGAANTAIAAARLGLSVGHLGEIGDDEGDLAVVYLREPGPIGLRAHQAGPPRQRDQPEAAQKKAAAADERSAPSQAQGWSRPRRSKTKAARWQRRLNPGHSWRPASRRNSA